MPKPTAPLVSRSCQHGKHVLCRWARCTCKCHANLRLFWQQQLAAYWQQANYSHAANLVSQVLR